MKLAYVEQFFFIFVQDGEQNLTSFCTVQMLSTFGDQGLLQSKQKHRI